MIDPAIFRRFVPTNCLPPIERSELARSTELRRLGAGETLFRIGSPSPSVLYLLAGEVELQAPAGAERVHADSERARHALSSGHTFATTAVCRGEVQVLYIDRLQLDRVLTWSQAGTIEVRDVNEEITQDWMATMLRSPVLQQVPPANIVRVIASVEQVDFAEGEMIIRHGAAGDYYYVVIAGNCRVLRPETVDGSLVEVDFIGPGGGFGEEALVSGLSRNASVEAASNCRLVRLPGRDFQRFLREPLVQTVQLSELGADAQCIDVRLPEEFAGGHLPGAINLPLRDLRQHCSEIDPARPAVVYCDGGGRSASATFLLRERGYNVRWIEGGVPSAHLTER